MDARHLSFVVPEYQKLAKKYKVTTVFTDSDKFPSFEEPEGEFIYSRLTQSDSNLKTGYAPKALDAWAERAQKWAMLSAKEKNKGNRNRDVFICFINGAKENASAAAGALLKRLGWKPAA